MSDLLEITMARTAGKQKAFMCATTLLCLTVSSAIIPNPDGDSVVFIGFFPNLVREIVPDTDSACYYTIPDSCSVNKLPDKRHCQDTGVAIELTPQDKGLF